MDYSHLSPPAAAFMHEVLQMLNAFTNADLKVEHIKVPAGIAMELEQKGVMNYHPAEFKDYMTMESSIVQHIALSGPSRSLFGIPVVIVDVADEVGAGEFLANDDGLFYKDMHGDWHKHVK